MAEETNQAVPAPPCAMVIFGASGDLTKRKLIPAIHNLATQHLLPQDFAVIGVARSEMSDEDFRNKVRDEMSEFATGELEDGVVEWLLPRLSYVTGELQDSATYEKLRERLKEVDEKWGTNGFYLFYLAVPPSQFATVVQQLGESGLAAEEDGRWRRVVIEKPFGHDLDSARALNREILKVLDEKQIYRIDHYLGKETVQNILVFRFANGIFEPIWNRRYVDHVQITVAETVGVEGVKVLCAIKRLDHEDVLRHAVRGQYDGYRQEPNVKPDSPVETYVALELFVEDWRWAGVPFYLRTGKHLSRRVTEVAIQFKCAPLVLFRETPV